MRRSTSSFLTAGFAAVTLLAAAPAFAAGASAQQPAAPSISAPWATQQWCDSLPYPYCRDPAPGTPGSGPIYAPARVAPHPIFGN